jgi:hypothetical protein
MDKDHFVDVSVIAEFKLMKQLTTDLDLIFSSIKDSDKVRIAVCKLMRPALSGVILLHTHYISSLAGVLSDLWC